VALTYLSSASYAGALAGFDNVAVITTDELAKQLDDRTTRLIVGSATPRDAFYGVLADAVNGGEFEHLPSFVAASARVMTGAQVAERAYVDEGAVIHPGAVVMPNTYVGRGAVIKPVATVGGDGFETAVISGRRCIVPHAGGAWIAEGAQIGSSTCVDRGLFGDFTFVGQESILDNLIHFAHSAIAGRACSLIACSEVSGSAVLEDGVWLGPNSTVLQGLRLGSHCYIGAASLVTRSLPPYSLAYGSPAKVAAWVCVCREKLTFVADNSVCQACGRSYRLADGVVGPS
jgi:UDP-3-O-[3-hydroxymyristoyl] glucosamine N-acyltransferase